MAAAPPTMIAIHTSAGFRREVPIWSAQKAGLTVPEVCLRADVVGRAVEDDRLLVAHHRPTTISARPARRRKVGVTWWRQRDGLAQRGKSEAVDLIATPDRDDLDRTV